MTPIGNSSAFAQRRACYGGLAGEGARGRSRTVQNRMARLSSSGTIVGYTVRLKPDVEEQRMRAS